MGPFKFISEIFVILTTLIRSALPVARAIEKGGIALEKGADVLIEEVDDMAANRRTERKAGQQALLQKLELAS